MSRSTAHFKISYALYVTSKKTSNISSHVGLFTALPSPTPNPTFIPSLRSHSHPYALPAQAPQAFTHHALAF